MNAALAIDQLAEILVRSDEDRGLLIGPIKHDIIGDAGFHFGNVKHMMPRLPKPFDNLPINAFVSQNVHCADSATGYTTSA